MITVGEEIKIFLVRFQVHLHTSEIFLIKASGNCIYSINSTLRAVVRSRPPHSRTAELLERGQSSEKIAYLLRGQGLICCCWSFLKPYRLLSRGSVNGLNLLYCCGNNQRLWLPVSLLWHIQWSRRSVKTYNVLWISSSIKMISFLERLKNALEGHEWAHEWYHLHPLHEQIK